MNHRNRSIREIRKGENYRYKAHSNEYHGEKLSVWCFFHPPIDVSMEDSYVPMKMRGKQNMKKPNVSFQWKYIGKNCWRNWSEVEGSNALDNETNNLFEECFSPSLVLHEKSKESLDLFLNINQISFMGSEDATKMVKKCEVVKQQMIESKFRALRELEEIMDHQIEVFQSSVSDRYKKRDNLLKAVRTDSLEEKISSCNVIETEAHPKDFTRLITNCSDVLFIIFSFLSTRDLIQNISQSCSYFLNYVSKKNHLRLHTTPEKMMVYPMNNVLRRYKFSEITFREIEISESRFLHPKKCPWNFQSFGNAVMSKLKSLILEHKEELKSLKIRTLQHSTNERDESYEIIKSYNPELMINDIIKLVPRLEHVVLSVIPSSFKRLEYLKRFEFQLQVGGLSRGAGYIHDRAISQYTNIQRLISYFENGNSRSLSHLSILADSQTFYERSQYEEYVFDLLEKFFDSICSGCPNLRSFKGIVFFGLRSFSNDFLQFLTKIDTFELRYYGKSVNLGRFSFRDDPWVGDKTKVEIFVKDEDPIIIESRIEHFGELLKYCKINTSSRKIVMNNEYFCFNGKRDDSGRCKWVKKKEKLFNIEILFVNQIIRNLPIELKFNRFRDYEFDELKDESAFSKFLNFGVFSKKLESNQMICQDFNFDLVFKNGDLYSPIDKLNLRNRITTTLGRICSMGLKHLTIGSNYIVTDNDGNTGVYFNLPKLIFLSSCLYTGLEKLSLSVFCNRSVSQSKIRDLVVNYFMKFVRGNKRKISLFDDESERKRQLQEIELKIIIPRVWLTQGERLKLFLKEVIEPRLKLFVHRDLEVNENDDLKNGWRKIILRIFLGRSLSLYFLWSKSKEFKLVMSKVE